MRRVIVCLSRRRKQLESVVVALAVCLTGCATYKDRVANTPGRPTPYEDPGTRGTVVGTGIESQDIVSATDKMVRDILACPTLASRPIPPRVVVDAFYFHNESSSIFNKNLFTDRLRTQLNNAADGKMVFIARHAAGMVEEERTLEERGAVTQGTQGYTKPSFGWDYRLTGRIASRDAVDARTGVRSTYHQLTFELVERGSGVIAWSHLYEFKKSAQDAIYYR